MFSVPKLIPPFLVAVSLLILGLSLNIENHSVFDPMSAAFFPALISIVLLLCGLAIWRRGVAPSSSEGSKLEVPESESVVEQEQITPSRLRKRIAIFVAAVFGFTFLMEYVHFLVLSVVYLFVSMLLLQRANWRTSLVTSVVTAAVIYAVFVYVFKIVFP